MMKIIAGQKLAQIMSNDLLDFHAQGKFFEPNQSSCSIKVLLYEVNLILEESLRSKHLSFSCQISDTCEEKVIVDGQRVQQVYLSLLSLASTNAYMGT